jgi:hypothetical protein
MKPSAFSYQLSAKPGDGRIVESEAGNLRLAES